MKNNISAKEKKRKDTDPYMSHLREIKISYLWKLVKILVVFILRVAIFLFAIFNFTYTYKNPFLIVLFAAFISDAILYVLKVIANKLGMEITVYRIFTTFWGKREKYEVGSMNPVLKIMLGLVDGAFAIMIFLLIFKYAFNKASSRNLKMLILIISLIICLAPFVLEVRTIIKSSKEIIKVNSEIKRYKSPTSS